MFIKFFLLILILGNFLFAGSVSNVWDSTKEASKNAWSSTKETSKEVWSETKEGSKEAWKEIKKAPKEIKEDSFSLWQDVKGWFK